MTPSPVPVGAVIAGKYRVEKVLGAGAMGVVLAARHMELLELRAIKLMLPAALENAEGVERFLREARAAARLRSQHVAKVHDVGRLDDGAPYAVIEYLEGADLKAILDERGTLPVSEAAMYLSQVCEAIGEAHAAGIVHRDLKPANLFLTRGPTGAPIVKVLDFGIAKMAGPTGAAADMTATTAMLGTPLYMSPEQMRGARDVDSRADIWALGVILYRMLLGRVPFSGSSLTEICAAVVADTPPAPRALRGDLPPDVEAVILRCLQKDPTQRFASAAELSAAFSRAAQSTGAPAAGPAAAPGGQGMSLMGTMLMDPPSAAAGPAGNATFGGRTGAQGPAPANATFGQGTGALGAAPGSATFGGGGMAAPGATFGAQGPGAMTAPGATFGAHGSGAMTAPAQPQASMAGAPAWQGGPPVGMQASPQAPAWGAQNAASPQASWGGQGQVPAPAPAKSRTGLFVGIGAVVLLGVGGAVAFVAWPSGSPPSQAPSGPGAAPQPPAAAGPGAPAQPTSSTGAKPSGRVTTPMFGQGPSPGASASFGVAPTAPGATTPPAASSAPAPPASTPAAGGASPKSVGALLGVINVCWKGNEGANKGEPASSATVQVTVGPPRSIVVSGPAKARSGFTACVVTKASSTPFEPGDSVVVASSSLPAGPP